MNYQSANTSEQVHLTPRELEILGLIVAGHSGMQVAEKLFVSRRTVEFHLANVYEKLHVTNRMQAMQCASRLGLLPLAA